MAPVADVPRQQDLVVAVDPLCPVAALALCLAINDALLSSLYRTVSPAKEGIQRVLADFDLYVVSNSVVGNSWVVAFAGMTS